MSSRRQTLTVDDDFGTGPVSCEEFGYGLGRPDGILVLRYRSSALLDFGESRQDLLHQFYWSPAGMLSARHGAATHFAGPGEVFWASRAVSHEVRATDHQTVYRVCLRQVPDGLTGLRAGLATIDAEAARLIPAIARAGVPVDEGLAARARIMAGLRHAPEQAIGRGAGRSSCAMTVARALLHNPADRTELREWAARLHVSIKTLQRDFLREYGTSYSRWRTELRLRASRVLLETRPVAEVAHRVGYATPSSFIAAFAREYGYTPGRRTVRG
jgi:AraC-like DNA-binding protein